MTPIKKKAIVVSAGLMCFMLLTYRYGVPNRLSAKERQQDHEFAAVINSDIEPTNAGGASNPDNLKPSLKLSLEDAVNGLKVRIDNSTCYSTSQVREQWC